MSTRRKRRASPDQPTGQWIHPVKRLEIYLRDGFLCAYCNRELHPLNRSEVTLDHLISKEDGGSNEAYNLITACKSCNSSRKSARQPFHPGAKRGGAPLSKVCDPKIIVKFLPKNWASDPRLVRYVNRKILLFDRHLAAKKKQVQPTEAEDTMSRDREQQS